MKDVRNNKIDDSDRDCYKSRIESVKETAMTRDGIA